MMVQRKKMNVSRLLLLSCDHDSSVALVDELCALCKDVHAPSIDGWNQADCTVLTLQTKYYHAAIEVHVHQVLDNEAEPELQHALCEYEAVICVVGDGLREGFLHLHHFATRLVDTFPFEVCLLVAATTSSAMQEEMERWCRDNGFEFVLWGYKNHTSNEDYHVMEEKQGIERVLEALQCNMWRSMEMKAASSETMAPLEIAIEKSSKENKEEKIQAVEEAEKDANTEAQGVFMAELQSQTLTKAEDCEQSSKTTDREGDDMDGEMDMTQFSALISEMQKVRDQGQSLSDTQRRDRAAEVAMKLWHLLGEDENDNVRGSE